jgi:hypothetical protein
LASKAPIFRTETDLAINLADLAYSTGGGMQAREAIRLAHQATAVSKISRTVSPRSFRKEHRQ